MTNLREAVEDFLAQHRIAVAGVSRTDSASAANAIFRKLRDKGYEVFPVNPAAEVVEHVACYADVASIPGGVDGVVVVTTPEAAEQVVRDCERAGVKRVWMHRSFGAGSVSDAAADYCREHGITVIAGGCPMMFCDPVDFPHKCMRWVLGATGGLPRAA